MDIIIMIFEENEILEIIGIEVTQGIQHFTITSDDQNNNNAKLVQGRTTMVRVYVVGAATGEIKPNLRVSNNNEEISTTLINDPAVIKDDKSKINKSDLRHSYNFIFNPGISNSSIELKISAEIEGSNKETMVTFLPINKLKLIVLLHADTCTPNISKRAPDSEKWKSCLQAAQIRFPLADGGIDPSVDPGLADAQYNLHEGAGWQSLLASLNNFAKDTKDYSTVWAMVVPENGDKYAYPALGVSGIINNKQTEYRRIIFQENSPCSFAHELGHALGSGHSRCPKNNPPQNIDNRLKQGFYGPDTGVGVYPADTGVGVYKYEVFPPYEITVINQERNCGELMSYCRGKENSFENRWPSADFWNLLLPYFISSEAIPYTVPYKMYRSIREPESDIYWSFDGWLDPTDKLHYDLLGILTPYPPQGSLDEDSSDSPLAIELLYEDGSVFVKGISETNYYCTGEPSDIKDIPISIKVPFDKTVRAITIKKNGRDIEKWEAGPTPKIQNLKVAQMTGVIYLTWDASHLNNKKMQYLVRYSKDDGRIFDRLSRQLDHPNYEIEENKIPGKRWIFQIAATDGFNTTTINSDQILRKQPEPSPQIEILYPPNGVIIPVGTPLFFNGKLITFIGEDVSISSVKWSSNLDGNLSDQLAFTTDKLSINNHIISLEIDVIIPTETPGDSGKRELRSSTLVCVTDKPSNENGLKFWRIIIAIIIVVIILVLIMYILQIQGERVLDKVWK
jgi:hypothetical protein